MATGGWNQDDLEKALALVKDHHASFREASQAYGIPKSTLHTIIVASRTDLNVVQHLTSPSVKNKNLLIGQ